MMAAEPSTDNSADVFASTELQSATDSQHGELVPPAVNGGSPLPEDIENKRITSVEDQINSADVSVSGGSDTEASRAKDGDKGQGRAGASAKRPATFKAVSVNKTFLASKANPNVSSKTSDKPAAGSSTPPPGSATLSISRPRLVAKSGSGTGNSTPRLSLANGGKPAAAPDPNVVWNKNRPTPAPEPKKFTDEELKKYGIHMASRLNEDDAQGQNKWADIDDDDDDWAPEAITWGDGTKTTLPHPDEPSARVAEHASELLLKSPTQDKPPSPAPLGATSSTPLPKFGGLPSGKGLVLKSAAQEKPVLVAKPPAPPTPAKSPWATLPPVKKASPGLVESVYPPRGGLRESSFATNMAPPPPRELAADDYSRSTWRDRSSYGNKELFNSRSGRYEPVPDRRPSMRSDSQTRHPAVLQRVPPSEHPAEPSAAFQTSRTVQEVPFGRRRGSSNVSGGSGSYLQRISKGSDGSMPPPPPELFGVRRGSLTGSVIESPVSPVAVSVMSQGQSRHQPLHDMTSRPSPGTTYAAPHHGNPQPEIIAGPPPQQLEDDIEYQKKLMREGVELARKRRQEEEAREEAARRERIQKKLEALGPPPEKKAEVKDAPKDRGVKTAPSQHPASGEQTEAPTAGENPPSQADSIKDDAATITHIEKPGFGHKDVLPANIVPPGPASRRLSHSQDSDPTSVWGSSAPRSDRLPSWVAGTPRNVWSSPDNNNGLGNGTFNPIIGRVSGTSAQPVSNSNAPAPIAPPTIAQPSSHSRNQVQAIIGSRATRYSNLGNDIANKWVTGVAENDKRISAAKIAERLGRERQLAERGVTVEDAQPAIKDTWRPVHIPGDGTRRAISSSDGQPNAVDPWKASRDELSKGVSPTDDSISGSQPTVIGNGGKGSVLPPNGPATTPQSRPSRFFPARDVRMEIGMAEPLRPSSPSPPPPTMEGHPVYEGDITRPHVSLPKPLPVVKLPPAMAAAQASQNKSSNPWANRASVREISRAPIHQGHSARRPSETSQENWQDRINNLLNGGKTSPPKHMGIDPASRHALDHTTNQSSTTVSLPFVTIQYSTESPQILTSKPMAEECFEEQEMGSLPQIRLPHKAPEAAWQPATGTKPMPKRFFVQPTVIEPYYFASEVVGGGNAVRIYFPGMSEPKVATIPFSAARGGRGSHRPSSRHRGGGHGSRGGGGGGGGAGGSGNGSGKREFSNSYGDSTSSSNSSRGGRGGYRNRGSDTWSRYPRDPSSLPA